MLATSGWGLRSAFACKQNRHTPTSDSTIARCAETNARCTGTSPPRTFVVDLGAAGPPGSSWGSGTRGPRRAAARCQQRGWLLGHPRPPQLIGQRVVPLEARVIRSGAAAAAARRQVSLPRVVRRAQAQHHHKAAHSVLRQLWCAPEPRASMSSDRRRDADGS